MNWDREFTHHELMRIYLGMSEDQAVDEDKPVVKADREPITLHIPSSARPTPLIDTLSMLMRSHAPSNEPSWKPPQGSHPAQDSRLSRLLDELTSPLFAEHLLGTLRKQMTPEIITALRSLPYERFLHTEYWLIVRAYVMQQRGRCCEQCHQTGDLNVHHLTYDHRGEEIFYLEDVRLLCEACHASAHGRRADS